MTTLYAELSYIKMTQIKPNFSELARKYGVDRHTIKKHYEAGGHKERKKRIYTSTLDQYKEVIESKLKEDGVTKIGVYYYLVNEKQCKTSKSNFKRYLKKHKLTNKTYKNTPHVRYETPYGKQLQVDWKENIKLITKNGEEITFNLFAATLGASRLHHFVFSHSKTEEAFIRCLIDTYNHIGGLTKEVLTDNMTAIVTCKGNKRYKHEKILQLEKDLGIKINLCKARTPETKGKVESSNRFVSRILAYNNEIESVDDIIKAIEKLNIDVNSEPNGTTKIAPINLFKKEKEYLLPIPPKCITDNYIQDSITAVVPNTLLVKYKGNEYSVPMQFINKRVKLLEIDNKLHIYYNTKLIRIHELNENNLNYNVNDYIEALRYRIHNSDNIEDYAKENLKLLNSYGDIKNE